MNIPLNPGAKCWYTNSLFGTVEAIVDDFHEDIKNGYPGYTVILDKKQNGETFFWGYADQVTARA